MFLNINCKQIMFRNIPLLIFMVWDFFILKYLYQIFSIVDGWKWLNSAFQKGLKSGRKSGKSQWKSGNFENDIKWQPCTHGIFLPQRNFGRHIVIALSVSPSISPSVPLSCPVHISYILWGRNSKFGLWIHLGIAECRVPWLGHCDLELDLWPSFLKTALSLVHISYMLWNRNSKFGV